MCACHHDEARTRNRPQFAKTVCVLRAASKLRKELDLRLPLGIARPTVGYGFTQYGCSHLAFPLLFGSVMRLAIIIAFLVAALFVGSCSAGGTHQMRPPNPDATDMLTGFTGVWNGTSTSSVNAAKVKISFDMNRDGNNLKGSYRCAPFNATCRNNIQNGWVHGQTSARGFTVSMEDSSWCTFVLDDFYPPAGDGEYTCYTNGGIADIGTFEVKGPSTQSGDIGAQNERPPS
jgi:hypothetical protein